MAPSQSSTALRPMCTCGSGPSERHHADCASRRCLHRQVEPVADWAGPATEARCVCCDARFLAEVPGA